MRTPAILIASLLIVACSGSDSSNATDTASTTTSDETIDTTDPSESVPTTAESDVTSTSTAASTTTRRSTTTTTPASINTVDGRISANSISPSQASTTVAPTSGTPTTTGASNTPSATTVAAATTTAPAPVNVPDAAMALNAFQQTIARNSGDDGYAELSECPLDPGGTLLAAAFADITVPDLASAITSPSESDIFDLPDDYGPMLACDRFSEDGPDSVGLFALAAPSDMNAYGELFGNPDEVEGVEILVDPTTAFGAGTFHHVCAFDELEPEFDFCEIDWVTDGVLIGVFVAGSNASAVDRAALEAGFAAQLVAIIEAFAA